MTAPIHTSKEKLNIYSVGDDVSIDSETQVVTS
jgi:hypothetical protein